MCCVIKMLIHNICVINMYSVQWRNGKLIVFPTAVWASDKISIVMVANSGVDCEQNCRWRSWHLQTHDDVDSGVECEQHGGKWSCLFRTHNKCWCWLWTEWLLVILSVHHLTWCWCWVFAECRCHGQADSCNPWDGQCYCNTRGVTGRYCDK